MRNCLALMLCVFLALSGTLAAQNRKQPEVETLRGSGKIKDMGRGMLLVDIEGKDWLIQLPRDTNGIHFVGAADVGFLKRGMMVRFVGAFDQRQRLQAPLRQIEVFTPRKKEDLGIKRDGGGTDLSNLFSSDQEKRDAANKPPEFVRYQVAGRLTGVNGNKLLVQVGRVGLRVELDEKAQVSFDVSDLRGVRKGDSVQVSARYYPKQQGKAAAQSVTITAQEPITSARPRSPKKKTGDQKKTSADGDKKREAGDKDGTN